jgi:hypothetical protein
MSRWLCLLGLGCGARVPVFSEGSDGFMAYELPEDEGECASDAECMENGCGNHCTAASAEPFVGTCEYAPHLDYASCGCVSERCRWFRRL